MAAPRGICQPKLTVTARQAGFSLVELLVTLMVIVLVTSVVSLNVNIGGDESQVELQVRELARTAEYALDEAQFTGLDYGLLVENVYSPEGDVYRYHWLERRIDGWRPPATGKELFEERSMPPGVMLELEIENSPFAATDLDQDDDVKSPQIVMYSSGEATVGAINVRRRADSELLWRLEWDLLGRFEVLLRGEEEYDDGGEG